ncbi:ICOS ligand [Kryptolebias marmoratus]|uniref:ICOS ligand-like n=1 Tax=Kryptolebias marmoratus TaxID=37003 RepID=A0A3Q3AZY0_KRYMA|nr:ICOS ligand [Kryptolebias marmoratus]
MRPQEGAAPVLALWCCAGLLLSSVFLCAGVERECVPGTVGQPVVLPCLFKEGLPVVNFSIEWRKDDKVVLRSMWDQYGNVESWRSNGTTIPADATRTKNFSLKLSAVDPREDRMNYSLFLTSGENQSSLLCTVCLRVAASFSVPLLERKDTAESQTTFLCHSTGGYPQPAVYWLINETQMPPEGSVRTQTALTPDSHLYNVTSNLTIPFSKDVNVSCIIENPSMNETLEKKHMPAAGPVTGRASEAMWIFSTALCVVVGLMVFAGVIYQIHLDKISKRRKEEHEDSLRGNKRRWQVFEEEESMMSDPKETEV